MMDIDGIDPQILTARALQAQVMSGADFTRLETAQGRALLNRAAMVLNDGKPELPVVETIHIPGPGGTLRCRLYQPENAAGRGAVYYIHGGGWFACDVDTHDRMLRYLAEQSGLSIFGIDYRLSPEHVFPAALEDCLAGWDWLHAEAASWGIDASRIAISGDSAGANLALSVTLTARESGRPMPIAAALLYGFYAPGLLTESRARFGGGEYGLNSARMDWYWANYLGTAAAAPPLLATPLYADFTGLPRHYIGIAAFDTLVDENHMIATRLRAAGVGVTLDVWPRLSHGALQMTRDVDSARKAVTAIADWLNKAKRLS